MWREETTELNKKDVEQAITETSTPMRCFDGKFTEKALEANTRVFAVYGAMVATRKGSYLTFLFGVIVVIIMLAGMSGVEYEDELDDLWVEEETRAAYELNLYRNTFGGSNRAAVVLLSPSDKRHSPNDASDMGVLTPNTLLDLRDMTEDMFNPEGINDFSLETELPVGGTPTNMNVTMGDLCSRPKVPPSLKPWTNTYGGANYTEPAMTLGWLASRQTDSGGLHYITNCLSDMAANALMSSNMSTVSQIDYIQLQMWFDQDVDTILDGTDGDKATLISTLPGLPDQWGVDKFPCTRANPLDCYAEGDYDYTTALKQLDAYAYQLAALGDSFTAANFTGLGLTEGPNAVEDLYPVNPLNAMGLTWFQTCYGGLTQSIKDAVRMGNGGVANTAAEDATATAVMGQLVAVGLRYGSALGYWWRPTVADASAAGNNEFAFSYYEAIRNARVYGVSDCIAEGAFRKLGNIKRHSSDPFAGTAWYSITPYTPINGGCCIAWAAIKVTSALFSGGMIPAAEDFDGTEDPATFSPFVSAFRIAISMSNHKSPFFNSRLNTELGVDLGMSTSDLEALPREMEQNWMDNMLEPGWRGDVGSGFAPGEAYDDLTVNFIMTRSVKDVLEGAAAVETHLLILGYMVLIVYACGTFMQFGTDSSAIVYSRGLVCFFGIGTIGMSTACSYGMMGYIGLRLSPMNSSLVPFLAMGLGIDDLFVIMHDYVRNHEKQDNAQVRMVQTLMSAGSSVTVTSAANVAAFLAPALVVRLPAVYTFSYQMAVAIFLNWVFLMTLFVPVVAADCRRCAKRISIFPSITTAVKESTLHQKADRFSMSKFVELYLAPLYSNFHFKVVALAIWVTFTIWLPLHGQDNTENGLRMSDVTLKGSYVTDYLIEQEALFAISGAAIMTDEIDYLRSTDGEPIDLAKFQQNIIYFLEDADANAVVDQTPPPSSGHWHPGLMSIYNALGDSTVEALFGVTDAATNYPRPAETVPSDIFYAVLKFYIGGLGSTQSENFVCRDENTKSLVECFDVDGENVTVIATKGSVFFGGLVTNDEHVNAIKSLRSTGDNSEGNLDACCNPTNNGTRLEPAHVFFTGGLFNYYQQYVNIGSTTAKTIGFSVLGIGIVLIIFQASPWSSMLVAGMLLSSVLQLYGLMSFFDIRLNGFSVTNLAIGMGMGVEFTAHIAYCFLRANAHSEDRDERVKLALIEIFPPMLSGAVTTFISVFVLAFAKFPFFRTYFFVMIALIILITFVNGMVFLPVVLSLVGPRGLSAKELKEIEETAEAEFQTNVDMTPRSPL